MARIHVFADESGDFDFSRTPGASRYFTVTTMVAGHFGVGAALADLRRNLAWEGQGLNSEFHAANDRQAVRDRVFGLLTGHSFRIDCTILEKAKAHARLRTSANRFYKYAWYIHMKHVIGSVVGSGDQLMVIGASIGTRKLRSLFHTEMTDVIGHVSPAIDFRVASWAAISEPCLQATDYCSWAIQRKWERGDTRSYDLINHKIATEIDVFRAGTTLYY